MGACGSSPSAEDKAQAKLDNDIDRANRQDNDDENRKIKLLLLGAGESGKSTIFKQMKILYGKNYTSEELAAAKKTIYLNIMNNFQLLVEYADHHDIAIETKDALSALTDADQNDPVEGELRDALTELWSSEGVQEAWAQRSLYQVLDSLGFYMGQIDRIGAPGYIPNKMDVLQARIRTSGIIQENYIIDGVEFVMFDVGGQRNERKKWLHCFDNVTAVIFVAAINEYDQVLYEDSETNRIDEAVHLFGTICNNTVFENTSMILFLNKKDIFEEKLFNVPLRVPGVRHDKFEGPYANDAGVSKEDALNAAHKYMTDLFVNMKEGGGSNTSDIYAQVVCSTDTDNVKTVFTSCKDIILRRNLEDGGFWH